MRTKRIVAALIVILALVSGPADALGATATTPGLSSTAPSGLSTGTTPATAPATAPAPAPEPAALPKTGFDLLDEGLLGLTLLCAGASFRRRPARR